MTAPVAVAVTGMSCRFPGASDPEAFWRLLMQGREGLSRFTDEELAARGVPGRLRRDPGYVPVGGLIDGQELFDPAPFGLTDAEAALLDPQQRIFLECAWQALERAGHGCGRDAGAVGVFAGAAQSAYLASNLAGRWDPTGGGADPGGSLQTAISTHVDYLPLQVAYRLGLTGPAIAVNTTCSTSLVAVHLAVQSLLAEECDTALAGGASLIVPQGHGYRYVPDGIFSVDGRVRPFSAEGTGIVYSQGVGVVVLRRLADALADGDPVLAVVHGSAVNNDGAEKAGFTAPSVGGQARVVAEALAVAGVTPRQIGYVEAHGTATRLGDPVETTALRRVFGAGPAWCGLGSVKGNIGHANSAAGIASFIKTVLARHHGLIPASLHADPVNDLLGLTGSPFQVVTAVRPWPDAPYAGVSSFGIGGTNCHVVLGPAPEPASPTSDDRPQLLLASGHTPAAARAAAADLAAVPADGRLADVAYTTQVGRRHGPHRVAVTVAGSTCRTAGVVHAPPRPPRLIFAFPGGGSQFAGMGAQLYPSEPAFAAVVDECADLFRPLIGADVRQAVRADEPGGVDRLHDPTFGLPALFTVSVALTRLFAAWRIRPDVVLGHSLGEYAAAVAAGVLALPDAVRLVATRCREMARVAGAGAMLAVPLPEDAVRLLLDTHPDLDLAAINGPAACVVTGPATALARLEADLRGRGAQPERLRLAAGPHSRLMTPALPAVRQTAAGITCAPPTVDYASTVTGALADVELTEPGYWERQLRQPVLFSAALRAAVGTEPAVLLQVGPGATLASLARQHALEPLVATLTTLPTDDCGADAVAVREAVGQLWSHGLELDLAALHRPGRRRVLAPGYAFQRRRLWIDPPQPGTDPRSEVNADEPVQVPVWRQTAPVDPDASVEGAWQVVAGADPRLAEAVTAALVRSGATVVADGACGDLMGVVVLPGDAGADRVTGEVLRYAALARTMRGAEVGQVLHVSHRATSVLPGEPVDPAAAAGTVLPLVLAQEHPGLRWRTLDLDPADGVDALARAVVAEAALSPDGPHAGARLALRARLRWQEEYAPWRPAVVSAVAAERAGRTALVVDGVGDVGMAIAGRLREAGYRVVLTTRRASDAVVAPEGVRVRQVDAGDVAATAQLLAELAADGALDLVVHAAGVAGEQQMTPLRDTTEVEVTAHAHPKVSGALALRAAVERLPEDRRPGSVVLMSSVAAQLGGVGAGPYAAANAAMDAIAQEASVISAGRPTRWLSIRWDGWRVDAAGEERAVALREALGAQAGLAALDRLLAAVTRGTAPPVVAVSARDLAAAARATALGPAPRRLAEESGATGTLSATERVVAELWADLFGAAVDSPEADFFALGGHSLLATRMLSTLRERFAAPLRLRDVLDHPTVAGLARLLDAADAAVPPHTGAAADPGTTERSGQPVPSALAADGTFPLTRVQHAYWVGREGGYRWGDRACHFYLEYDCPELDLDRYEAAWRRVIARHPMLRAVVTPQGRMRVLENLPPYRLRVHDLSDGADVERRLAGLRERISTRPGPPDRWPLFTVQAARLPGTAVRLFIGVDVLICDASSWWLIDRQVQAYYRNPDAVLPEPQLHPAQCVAALTAGRTSGDTIRAADYWRDRAAELPPAPALPMTGAPDGRFVRRTARLSAARWRALLGHAARHRLTPAAVLLAAYADTLRRWTGEGRFSIMLTLFDRPDLPGVRDVVGDFTSLVVHEVDHRPGGTFVQRAAAAQRRLFTDLDHREFSALDLLAEISSAGGRLASVPVVFTSALGVTELLGADHDLQWIGRQVHAVSQTPQTLLDLQVLEQRGELWLQWDALEPVLEPGQVQDAFDDYVERVSRLADDPGGWDTAPDRPLAEARTVGPALSALPDVALPIRGGRSDRTLFLMHPSGGDVLCYTDLARQLDERVRLVALTDPALVGAEAPTTMAELAALYLAVVRRLQPDGPYLLGGWSMGGTLAQEMARQAHAEGAAVPLLVMVDSNDPTYIRPVAGSSPAHVQAELVVRQFGALEAYLGIDLGSTETGLRERLAAAPEAERLAEAERRLRAHRLLGRAERLSDRLAILDRHLAALAAYRPGRLDAADTSTLLLRADRPSPRNAGIGMGVDDTPAGLPDLGWRAHLAGPLRTVGVDAHHYSVLRTPAVEAVAAEINRALRRALP